MNYERGVLLVLGSSFLVPCSWFLQGGGECFQGVGLDSGFEQGAQAGRVMDTHDDLTQTVGDLAKTYLQCFQYALLKTLLKALLLALLLAFFTKLIGKCHGGGLKFALGFPCSLFLVLCAWFLGCSWFFVLGALFIPVRCESCSGGALGGIMKNERPERTYRIGGRARQTQVEC